MSLVTKKGTFAFPDSGSPLPITGVGFQPKAVLFWMTQQSSVGYAANKTLSVGWGVSATQRGCLSSYSADAVAVGTSNGQSIRNDLCIRAITCVTSSVTAILDADFVSMDSDGFTIQPINISVGALYIVHYLAIGGSDLTNAFAGVCGVPVATGSQAFTGFGFQPDSLLVLGNTTGTIPRDDLAHKISLGAASSASDQAVASIVVNDAVPTNAHSVQKTGEIIHTLRDDGTDFTIASLVSLDSDGFTANFTTVPGTARDFLVLGLKGGRFKVATDTQKTSTGTKAKAGVGFQPTGLLLWGTNRASSASTDATLASLSIGATDGTNEGATWIGSVDNVSTTEENSATVTDKVLRHATGPSTTDAEADLSSFDVDGYTLNWSTADAVAREFVGLAIGSSLGSQHLAPSADSVDGTWTDQGGGTSLAAAIDEAVFSDTDYIQSVDSPSAAGCRVKLAAGSDPALSTGHVIHWRVRKNVAGQTVDMTVKLYQGGGNVLGAGTLIATRTRNNVSTAFATFDETLTGTEADAITNYADLYLEFFATAS